MPCIYPKDNICRPEKETAQRKADAPLSFSHGLAIFTLQIARVLEGNAAPVAVITLFTNLTSGATLLCFDVVVREKSKGRAALRQTCREEQNTRHSRNYILSVRITAYL